MSDTNESKAFEIVPLNIEVRGEVVASNFIEFRKLISESLANINKDLTTDQEFGQAETDVKSMKEVESVVSEAKETALKQAEQLHKVFAEMDEVSEEVRQARLNLEHQIKDKKQQLNAKLVEQAIGGINVDRALAEKTYLADIQNAIKGKRTLASMKKAVLVAQTNINNGIAQTCKVLDDFEHYNGKSLIMDRHELEVKECTVVAADLQRRLQLKKSEDEKREAEAKRKQAEAEAAKAKEETKAVEAKAQGAPLPPKQVAPSKPAPSEADANQVAEWEAFKGIVHSAFGSLKPAKGALKFQVNQQRAQRFSEAVNAAWKEANAK